MGKINEHRTGQAPNMLSPGRRVPASQLTPISTVQQIPQGGGGNGNGGGGGCFSPGPGQPMSWGAACPTGYCTAHDLAESLGRAFAGERYPCRELTYWTKLTADANGVADTGDSKNSKVTICPTRIVAFAMPASANALLEVFQMGNQNEIIGDPIPIQLLDPDSFQIIPYVTDCLRAGLPFRVRVSGLTATTGILYFGLIGPTIG